jgi:hypothetical protein
LVACLQSQINRFHFYFSKKNCEDHYLNYLEQMAFDRTIYKLEENYPRGTIQKITFSFWQKQTFFFFQQTKRLKKWKEWKTHSKLTLNYYSHLSSYWRLLSVPLFEIWSKSECILLQKHFKCISIMFFLFRTLFISN